LKRLDSFNNKKEKVEMAKKEEVKEQVMEKEVKTNKVDLEMVNVPMYDDFCFGMIHKDGKFHALKFPFNRSTLQAGKGEVIESNTDLFIIQERVHILILDNDKFDV